MPTNVNTPDTTALPAAARKASTMTRFVQAAVLAVVLVPLGSVALEAAIISSYSCAFYNFDTDEDSCGGSTGSDTREFSFDFGTLTLTLFGMSGSTDITVTNATLTDAEFDELYNGIAAADCVPIFDGTVGCRMIEITASNPSAFTGWAQKTLWNTDTNLLYPNGDGDPGQVRVYRSEGELDTTTGALIGQFTEDMCLAALSNSNYTPCEYFPVPALNDPGIRSGDTAFSVLAIVHIPSATSVPEPSTMLLLGTGVAGLVFRRRRDNV